MASTKLDGERADYLHRAIARDESIIFQKEDAEIEKNRDHMLLVKWRPLLRHPLPVSEEKFANDRLMRRLNGLHPSKRALLAAAEGRAWCIEECYIKGCPIEVTNGEGYKPLHLAASLGHVEAVRVLLNIGVDPNDSTMTGFLPLALAVASNHTQCATLIREAGGVMQAPDPDQVQLLRILDVDIRQPPSRVIDQRCDVLKKPRYPWEL